MVLKRIWSRWFKRQLRQHELLPDAVTAEPGVSRQRAVRWLGEDHLDRQRFYEKWAARETWLIYAEGLPLLFGRDPEAADLEQDAEFSEQREQFWDHLQRCVRQRMPPVLNNPTDKPVNWRAEPVELYRWAVAARVPIPEELDTLLAFISTTVATRAQQLFDLSVQSAQSAHDTEAQSKSLAREQVLSALLSLSLQALHQASGRDGDALRTQLLQSLYDKSSGFFQAGEPPLSRPALHDLIDRSLAGAGLIRFDDQ